MRQSYRTGHSELCNHTEQDTDVAVHIVQIRALSVGDSQKQQKKNNKTRKKGKKQRKKKIDKTRRRGKRIVPWTNATKPGTRELHPVTLTRCECAIHDGFFDGANSMATKKDEKNWDIEMISVKQTLLYCVRTVDYMQMMKKRTWNHATSPGSLVRDFLAAYILASSCAFPMFFL